jgi:hypothetical protein
LGVDADVMAILKMGFVTRSGIVLLGEEGADEEVS